MRYSHVIVMAAAALLFSCTHVKNEASHLYNLDSLVNAQVVYLSEVDASLRKSAVLGSAHDTTKQVLKDSAQWANELSIFAQLHAINKPFLRKRYTLRDGLADERTNLSVRLIEGTSSPDEDPLTIPYLKIYYQGSPKNVRIIEGVFNEQNTLFKSSRFLRLTLQDIHNKTVLTSYSVNGGQKMILGDSVTFSITGTIIVP